MTDDGLNPPGGFPTDPERERALDRIPFWLDVEDADWLVRNCICGTTSGHHAESCTRIRFRADAALHKAGWKDERPGDRPHVSAEPTVSLLRDQVRFAGLWVASLAGASSVDISMDADGRTRLMVYDKTGELIARRELLPEGNEL